MEQKTSPLAPFRVSTFRNLWSATLVSNLGGLIQVTAAGWLMTSLTTSSSVVTLTQTANTLPVVVLSLAVGALADNFNRRHIMLTAQFSMMAVSIALVLLTYFDLMTPLILLFCTFLIGCFNALYNPPWQATVGDIVPKEQISSAVTLNSVGFNLMRSVGPAIGGAIVKQWSATGAFICNAFSYIPLLIALFLWKPTYEKKIYPREKLVGAMSDGLRYVMMSPHLINIMVRAFLFGCGAISVSALIPLVAKHELGGSSLVYGTLLGCYGIGAILAGIFNARLRAHLRNETIIIISFLGFAFSCLSLAISYNIIISHLVLIPAGMCWVFALSLFNTSVQLSTPRWVVSRALALYQTASFGGMALGALTWGQLADAYSIRTSLMICSAFLVIGALAGIKFRIFEIPNVSFEPNNQFREPELRLDLKARSGPIMIMVDYHISEENLNRFLKLMVFRRNRRIRDGARNWTLLNDLEDPEMWTETYHMPTWVDYLRHINRRTKQDIILVNALRHLDKSPGGVRVHRMIERHRVPGAHEVQLKPPIEPNA